MYSSAMSAFSSIARARCSTVYAFNARSTGEYFCWIRLMSPFTNRAGIPAASANWRSRGMSRVVPAPSIAAPRSATAAPGFNTFMVAFWPLGNAGIPRRSAPITCARALCGEQPRDSPISFQVRPFRRIS